MIIKTFVVGCLGFLGRHFLRAYQKQGFSTFGTQHVNHEDPFYFDLEHSNWDWIPEQSQGYTYALIATASHRLADCEKLPEKSFQNNVTHVLELVRQLVQRKITPILFSTAYVFDGKSNEYTERSPLNPLNQYGWQKAVLETRLPEVSQGNYLLLRLNKVFSIEKNGGSFFDLMASDLLSDRFIRVVTDQILAPIWVEDVIKATLHLQSIGAKGLFNLCGAKRLSRLELAIAMVDSLGKPRTLVESILLQDLADGIKRPNNTYMDCSKILSTGCCLPTDLEDCIKHVSTQWS